MTQPPVTVERRTTAGTRRILLVASILVFLVGIQLFVLTEMTDTFFAWTIRSPLTAAFLGAAYWASAVMEFTAARQQTWAAARIAVPAVLVFTGVTLVVTVLHLDLFHLDSASVMTGFLTWAWLFVYAVVPPVMLALLVRQVRAGGADPRPETPLSGWFRALLITHAGLLIPLGVGLLLIPEVTGQLWPWSLTPLTGRAIGAWLLGLGIAAVHAAGENDWRRIRPATMSYVAFAVLQFIAVARYPEELTWAAPHTWVYLLFLLSAVFAGIHGWRQASREAHAATPRINHLDRSGMN